MKKTLFVFGMMMYSLISVGQEGSLLEDSLEDKMVHFHIKENYDSLIFICNQIKILKAKKANKEGIDYYLAEAYYQTKQYDNAIYYCKAFLNVSPSNVPYHELTLLVRKRQVCENLCEIYKERHDTLTALKYLLIIEKKYPYTYCYSFLNGQRGINFYNKIIECYTTLNNKKGIAKYQKKIAALEK